MAASKSRKEAVAAARLRKYKHMLKCFEILKHRCLYYVWDAPEISDAEYDKLERQLEAYERRTGITHPRSPTQTVGSSLREDYPVLVRGMAMQSLFKRGWRIVNHEQHINESDSRSKKRRRKKRRNSRQSRAAKN